MSGVPGWVKQAPGPGGGSAANAVCGPADPLAETDGTLLGGRIAYRQFRDGFRTGLEPVLMAAAVPARGGQRVIEAGCGAGAGLLCLAARVPGLDGVGVEQDPATAALAGRNLRCNALDWPVASVAVRDAARLAGTPPWLPFHHAFANPPWHRADATRSPLPRRDLARRAPPDALEQWVAALAVLLRRGGSLTLALPASLHARAAASMLGHGFGSLRLLPFWPRAGRPARIVLLQGTAGGRGDSVLLPGLVLHGEGNGFTAAADRILREGAAIPMR